MRIFEEDVVVEILGSRPGIQRVLLASGERAYLLSEIIGEAQVGDRLVCNKSAVELNLGTGGWHVAHWNLDRLPGEYVGGGHVMKARYTSVQMPRPMIEELYPEPIVPLSQRLNGRKVLLAGLHSQVGIAAITLRHAQPAARIGYVMTDGAALPLALSDLVYSLEQSGVINHTVTSGQAFGGDFESLTTEAAVAGLFEHLNCDFVVIGMGPGIAGTGTTLGQTSIECAHIAATLTAMGATVAFALRFSSADDRERHSEVSHHSITNLELMPKGTIVGVPQDVRMPVMDSRFRSVDTSDAMGHLSQDVNTPSSMGRNLAQDPLFYSFTAASALALTAIDTM